MISTFVRLPEPSLQEIQLVTMIPRYDLRRVRWMCCSVYYLMVVWVEREEVSWTYSVDLSVHPTWLPSVKYQASLTRILGAFKVDVFWFFENSMQRFTWIVVYCSPNITSGFCFTLRVLGGQFSSARHHSEIEITLRMWSKHAPLYHNPVNGYLYAVYLKGSVCVARSSCI